MANEQVKATQQFNNVYQTGTNFDWETNGHNVAVRYLKKDIDNILIDFKDEPLAGLLLINLLSHHDTFYMQNPTLWYKKLGLTQKQIEHSFEVYEQMGIIEAGNYGNIINTDNIQPIANTKKTPKDLTEDDLKLGYKLLLEGRPQRQITQQLGVKDGNTSKVIKMIKEYGESITPKETPTTCAATTHPSPTTCAATTPTTHSYRVEGLDLEAILNAE